MRIAHLSPEDAVESLRSTLAGLTGVEARRRLAEYGVNRVEELRSRSLGLSFLEEFTGGPQGSHAAPPVSPGRGACRSMIAA
jgi:hypothetical protein